MTDTPSNQETCRRSGVVLSCYLDGRKYFRAIRTPVPARAAQPVKRRRDA